MSAASFWAAVKKAVLDRPPSAPFPLTAPPSAQMAERLSRVGRRVQDTDSPPPPGEEDRG